MKRKETPIKPKAANNTVMNIKEIESLIKFVQTSGVAEVSLEQKDFKLTIRTSHGSTTVFTQQPQVLTSAPVHHAPSPSVAPPSPSPSPASSEAIKATEDSKYVTIKSPMIGTFYRSSSPDKPLFVNVGDTIKQGQVLCIIEAMKLFNEIESEISGKIVKVLVDNSTPVEYDQPLFLVEPK
jgi:acetyl-CoA carboxylase biotin carboxyl carrier protein